MAMDLPNAQAQLGAQTSVTAFLHREKSSSIELFFVSFELKNFSLFSVHVCDLSCYLNDNFIV